MKRNSSIKKTRRLSGEQIKRRVSGENIDTGFQTAQWREEWQAERKSEGWEESDMKEVEGVTMRSVFRC